MKKNKLFTILTLLIIICLLSIAASFKQCGTSGTADSGSIGSAEIGNTGREMVILPGKYF